MEKKLLLAVDLVALDNAREGIALSQRDGSVEYANQALLGLMGLEDRPATVADLFYLAEFADFQQLLAPPWPKTQLLARNGFSLQVQSLPYPLEGEDLVKIMVVEDQAAADGNKKNPSQIADGRLDDENKLQTNRQLQLILDTLQAGGTSRAFLAECDDGPAVTSLLTVGFSEPDRGKLYSALAAEAAAGAESISHDREVGPSRPSHLGRSFGNMDLFPLYDADQRQIGLLGLDDPDGNMPTVTPLAELAAVIIGSKRTAVHQAADQRNSQLLLRASNDFSGSLDLEAVLGTIARQLLECVGAECCTIYELDSDTAQLVSLIHCTRGSADPFLPAERRFRSSIGELIGSALSSQLPLVTLVSGPESAPLRHDPRLFEGQSYTSICLPILLSDEAFGLVELALLGQPAVGANDLDLLQGLLQQGAAALETALVFDGIVKQEQFYNALGRVSLAMNFALNKAAVLELIADESLRIFDVEGAFIWLRDGDQYLGKAASGTAPETFSGRALAAGHDDSPFASISNGEGACFSNNIKPSELPFLQLPDPNETTNVLCIPFEQEGEFIGMLLLVDGRHANRFRERDATRAAMFGAQVSTALRNAQLFDELRLLNEELDTRVASRTEALRHESERVKTLLRITSELSASLDQDKVLNRALELVNESVKATGGVIMLINPDTSELDFRARLGKEALPPQAMIPSGLQSDEGLAGWMIKNGSAVIVHDAHKDSRWVILSTSSSYRSVLGVPLISSGEAIGVLMLFHTDTDAFTTQQLQLVEAAAHQVASAINNASLYQLIREQSESLGYLLLQEQIEAAKSQSILESIADGVIVANADNQIILANLAASSILRLTRDELLGKLIGPTLGQYDAEQASWNSAIDEWALDADLIEPGAFQALELPIGESIISIHLAPVLVGRQFFGTVSILRDITWSVEVDRLKSEFVSTVSHELRTPMTAIKGYADLMLMGATGAVTESQARYLTVIKNNANRLHNLVNDVLEISRIEEGRAVLDRQLVDVGLLIQQVVDGHLQGRIQHEKKHVEVRSEFAANLPRVNVDRARIIQVVTNLLDNALNYTPADGIITVQAVDGPNFVTVRVSDTGIGIAKDVQAKIFERFYRAGDEDVQKVAGTGLGLAIVRNIIDMHGGELTVSSELGMGSTFEFTLPINM